MGEGLDTFIYVPSKAVTMHEVVDRPEGDVRVVTDQAVLTRR
jgi:hypothetical protein